MKVTLKHLNTCNADEFVRVCGQLFEHSPWIARRTFDRRPFADLPALHDALCRTMFVASPDEQAGLIGSHPDLVGKLAREGRLTRESTSEQAAAGLTRLTDDDLRRFDEYNAEYRARFGFPFVICARENRKDAILTAFPARLKNSRELEIATALAEIARIARLRLLDAVSED